MNQIKGVPSFSYLFSPDWQEYELLDSGAGMKLERYGKYVLARPEAEAIWQPALAVQRWESSDASFKPAPEENGGHWDFRRPLPASWQMSYKDLRFLVQTTNSRHVGVFPEQAAQWDWIEAQITAVGRPLQVLNLFGYTGIATLAAARAGAAVTHVDASKKVVDWARQNQQLSGLEQRPIRWIVDDALKFVRREGRRGTTYDGIILDPPKFGRGPKGEVWEFYKLLPNLLQSCREILSRTPQFVVLTAYAVKASSLTIYYSLDEMMSGFVGQTTAGEVVLKEKSAGRILSTAIFARWSAHESGTNRDLKGSSL